MKIDHVLCRRFAPAEQTRSSTGTAGIQPESNPSLWDWDWAPEPEHEGVGGPVPEKRVECTELLLFLWKYMKTNGIVSKSVQITYQIQIEKNNGLKRNQLSEKDVARLDE